MQICSVKRFSQIIPVLILLVSLASGLAAQPDHSFKIAKLKYEGGGDWYSNPTSLPNLIKYVKQHTNVQIAEEEDIVEPGGTQIFQYPFVYMTGHGNVAFSDDEARNLRQYLLSGGFLHIDDNYGMDKYVRREMKKVFPELDFIELPYTHGIYHEQYEFADGLPKIHEHDKKPAQGFGLVHENRLVCYYTYESDLGDGWEDPLVHRDPPEVRETALKMGTNVLLWALKN